MGESSSFLQGRLYLLPHLLSFILLSGLEYRHPGAIGGLLNLAVYRYCLLF